MIAKAYSAIPQGYQGHIIEVEAATSKSLPCFNIVGMANKTVTEARERVRLALTSSGFTFPNQKITINLAPAELAKDGPHLDLSIALAILAISKQLPPASLDERLFVGELSLDGQTKSVRGIINTVEIAKISGFKEVILPRANLATASLIPDIKLVGVDNLTQAFLYLKGELPQTHSGKISTTPPQLESSVVQNTYTEDNQSKPNIVKITKTPKRPNQASKTAAQTSISPTLDQISGHAFAKRALTIAIAGHHNLLLHGPPGSGKTLLAKTAVSLLPPPSLTEQIEITKLHSLAYPTDSIITKRPFRAPHHSASTTSIIGGGHHILPGEISLAHRGILFLDELPEFRRDVLEALRQPLEDKTITISRANQHLTYPANFTLLAALNPCPCGYYGDPQHSCTCTASQIQKYHQRISGPILDRFDLSVNIQSIEPADLLINPHQNIVKNTQTANTVHSPLSEHNVVKNTITEAIQVQYLRYQDSTIFNGDLNAPQITQFLQISPAASQLLNRAAKSFNLSSRAYIKVIKVAQTIADLSATPEILPEHISESLSFRQQIS